MWRYIRALLIGSLMAAVVLSVTAVQKSMSHEIGISLMFIMEQNTLPLLFAQSLLFCLFLARSGDSHGLKWLAFGLWMQLASPGLSMLPTLFGLHPSSWFRYISVGSS